jgi:uncharacterized protein (TIGR02145 family)
MVSEINTQFVNIIVSDSELGSPSTGLMGSSDNIINTLSPNSNTALNWLIIVGIIVLVGIFLAYLACKNSLFKKLFGFVAVGLLGLMTLTAGAPTSAAQQLVVATSTATPTIEIVKNHANPELHGATASNLLIVADDDYTLHAKLDDSDLASNDISRYDINLALQGSASQTTLSNLNQQLDIQPNSTPAGDLIDFSLTASLPNDTPVGTYTAKLVYTVTIEDSAPDPITMQTMTQTQCEAMDIYDGTNPDAILTLNDIRNDQPYQIAKLADDNCWMLNNLKLGSASGGMDLTPADTNIATNWTLPQLNLYTMGAPDVPMLNGPAPGQSDDITSDKFFGFVYNWCAATADGLSSGGSDTCTADGDYPESATGDICPASWRLPRGGDESLPTTDNEIDMLNARMAGFADNLDSDYQFNNRTYYPNWQFDGPFKGVFAYSLSYEGAWRPQSGDVGQYLTSSALEYRPESTQGFNIEPNSIDLSFGAYRDSRYSVRCVLK